MYHPFLDMYQWRKFFFDISFWYKSILHLYCSFYGDSSSLDLFKSKLNIFDEYIIWQFRCLNSEFWSSHRFLENIRALIVLDEIRNKIFSKNSLWFSYLINVYPFFTHMMSLSGCVTLYIKSNLPFSLEKIIYSLHWHSIFSNIHSWIDRIDESKFAKPRNICIFWVLQINISRVKDVWSLLDTMLKHFQEYLNMEIWYKDAIDPELRSTWWAMILCEFSHIKSFHNFFNVFFDLPKSCIKIFVFCGFLQKCFALLECSFEHPVSLTIFGVWDDFERIYTR